MTTRHLVDAHVLLIRDGRLLLSKRRGADEFDGRWHLPAGKVEVGESATAPAGREADEEIGVHIDPADLRHVHTAHVIGSGHEPRLGLFFEVRTWRGEPANREPDKCYELRWFPLDDLPADIIAYPTAGISALSTGATYSERGWNAEAKNLSARLSLSETGAAIVLDPAAAPDHPGSAAFDEM
ncbi:NUDIX hydrolase [Nocardia brasiliensis]|uniref:NUDIX hydrolase n=1 Tax=Nocardia brasiliensis TaxID=37326 RepID=UPI002457C308|nr:NUDIX domain-containing protein [Nocardia brasiliensis]